MTDYPEIYVLGIGNILCGDDGFGSHLATLLQASYLFEDKVKILDLGVQSHLIAGLLAEKSKYLFLDAADFGKTPGSLYQCEKEEIPVWLASRKLSAHQASLAEALALAELTGQQPRDLHLIAFQPCNVEFGAAISTLCQNALPHGLNMALNVLSSWGCTPIAKTRQKAHMHPDLCLDNSLSGQYGSN